MKEELKRCPDCGYPLSVIVEGDDNLTPEVVCDECGYTCYISDNDNGQLPSTVDRLTAQRDELLAACKAMVKSLDLAILTQFAITPGAMDAVKQIRAAIAKCEGNREDSRQ